MLAEQYGKISADELAATDEAGGLVRAADAATLEEIVTRYIHGRSGPKVGGLSGSSLACAARLLGTYCRYLHARVVATVPPLAEASPPSESAPAPSEDVGAAAEPPLLEQFVLSFERRTTAATGAATATTKAAEVEAVAPSPAVVAAPPDIPQQLTWDILELLRVWMAGALAAAPEPPARPIGEPLVLTEADKPTDGFTARLVDPCAAKPRRPRSAEEAVVHAADALIVLHAACRARGLLADGGGQHGGRPASTLGHAAVSTSDEGACGAEGARRSLGGACSTPNCARGQRAAEPPVSRPTTSISFEQEVRMR